MVRGWCGGHLVPAGGGPHDLGRHDDHPGLLLRLVLCRVGSLVGLLVGLLVGEPAGPDRNGVKSGAALEPALAMYPGVVPGGDRVYHGDTT